MKKVRFFEKEPCETANYANFHDMISREKYIGYIAETGHFMVITQGSARGYAVSPIGTCMSLKEQAQADAQGYRVFQSLPGLVEWLHW